MKLKSLMYTSWASPGLRSPEVESILASARTNNPLQGLSGVLIFNGSHFLQILEGVEPAINELVVRLKGDKRHSNMSIRDERWITNRTFPDWAMAYLLLNNNQFVGEAEVERMLSRDLPEPLRNLIRGLTHSFIPS